MSEVPRVTLRDDQVVKLTYYNIRVFSSESDDQRLASNNSLGRLILFLGLTLIIISGIDSSQISWTLTQSEQSIWANSGKGIWIGLLVMNVGIFTIIAAKEKSHSSFKILLPYVIVSMIFCLFGLLTSISVLDRYIKDPFLSKNKEQNVQFALSGLLIGIFGLCFLFLSCLSCLICSTIPTFCKKSQSPHPQPFYSNRRLSQDIPLQTPRPPRNSIRYYSRPYRYPLRCSFNRAYQT